MTELRVKAAAKPPDRMMENHQRNARGIYLISKVSNKLKLHPCYSRLNVSWKGFYTLCIMFLVH